MESAALHPAALFTPWCGPDHLERWRDGRVRVAVAQDAEGDSAALNQRHALRQVLELPGLGIAIGGEEVPRLTLPFRIPRFAKSSRPIAALHCGRLHRPSGEALPARASREPVAIPSRRAMLSCGFTTPRPSAVSASARSRRPMVSAAARTGNPVRLRSQARGACGIAARSRFPRRRCACPSRGPWQ